MSTYDNMPLIGDELQQGQNGNFSVPGPQVMPPQGQYQGPQPMQPHNQPPPVYRFNPQNQGFNRQPPPMYNMNNSQNYTQQPVGYNTNHTYQQPQGFNNQSQQVIIVLYLVTITAHLVTMVLVVRPTPSCAHTRCISRPRTLTTSHNW